MRVGSGELAPVQYRSRNGATLVESAADEALRRENPKGRLWERCAQLRLELPRVRYREVRDVHQAEMSLDVGEWELTSGVQFAGTRQAVEQLAARELLAELEALLAESGPRAPSPVVEDDDVWEVGPDDLERLRQTNPKGLVYEWCQKRRPQVARPRFETRRVAGRVHVRATLSTLQLSSPWFHAVQVKAAEQAAAEALLPLLPDEAEVACEPIDPRATLNELRQRGVVREYAFDVRDANGSTTGAERPFTAVGRMTLPSGAMETTEPMQGQSKKEATVLAAVALLRRAGHG